MPTNEQPILTIAIPTYNRDFILSKALDNLLPQLSIYEDDIELIISDNASTDNTQEVIKEKQLK
jgi:abequosyltransferase